MSKRERIIVEMMLRMPQTAPDVPFAEGIEIEALTQADKDAGRDPFFITLPLGERDQESNNGRYYVGDVAINAIFKAITVEKIGGNQGHTPASERGTHFAVPVLHWVGALIQDGIVWGKAYVPGDSERMREMRGYYTRQDAIKGNVGTSLEGWGVQTYNSETEMLDIMELEVVRVDAVEALGVGVDIAGSKTPHITSELLTEAVQLDDLDIGDLVSWEDNGALIRGLVNSIWTEGDVDVPYSDSPPLKATAEEPIARMDVYHPNYDDGKWVISSYQVVRYFSQITKIDRLPELSQIPSMSEVDEDDINKPQIKEATMPEPKEAAKPEDSIAELTQQHETEVTTLTGQLQEANRELRPLRASIATLREALALDESADLVEAVRTLMSERESLAGENTALLESAIQAEVMNKAKIINEALLSEAATTVTFGKTVQSMISTKIQSEKIALHANIAPAVERVLGSEDVKAMLESLKIAVMGPNVENQFGKLEDENKAEEEAVTY